MCVPSIFANVYCNTKYIVCTVRHNVENNGWVRLHCILVGKRQNVGAQPAWLGLLQLMAPQEGALLSGPQSQTAVSPETDVAHH